MREQSTLPHHPDCSRSRLSRRGRETQSEVVPCKPQVFLGQTLHQLDELLPANSLPLDDLCAVALLVFFGVKTLLVTFRAYPFAHQESALRIR